jgi:hypothetical protein
MDKNIAKFEIEPWFSLNDPAVVKPVQKSAANVKPVQNNQCENIADDKTRVQVNNNHSALDYLGSDAKTLLYHLVIKPGFSVREIMKELDFSGSTIEKAKHELITLGLIIESRGGKKKYLIPKKEAFGYFGIVCPYANTDFVEHSFYMHMLGLTLKKNPSCKKVSLEYKLTDSGNTADVVTTGNDGRLCAFEVTDSLTNIVQNSFKYEGLDAFSKITFVCRNDDILKAVKSRVLNAGLPLALLSKLDFILLSSILKD